jgi:hypothetical protein
MTLFIKNCKENTLQNGLIKTESILMTYAGTDAESMKDKNVNVITSLNFVYIVEKKEFQVYIVVNDA